MPRKAKLKKTDSTAEKIVMEGEQDIANLSKGAESNNTIFQPAGELVVDVFETDQHFVVLTALAGVKIEDLDIAVEKDMMVIKGHRQNPFDNVKNNTEKKYIYQECYWGPFSKQIVLPENVDTKSASAEINKGILTIKIPKVVEVEKKEVALS